MTTDPKNARPLLHRALAGICLLLIACGLWLCGQQSPSAPDAYVPDPAPVVPDASPDAGAEVADGGSPIDLHASI